MHILHHFNSIRLYYTFCPISVRGLEKAKAAGTFAAAQSASLDGATSTGKGSKHYDAGSGSESSDSEETGKKRRKKLKT